MVTTKWNKDDKIHGWPPTRINCETKVVLSCQVSFIKYVVADDNLRWVTLCFTWVVRVMVRCMMRGSQLYHNKWVKKHGADSIQILPVKILRNSVFCKFGLIHGINACHYEVLEGRTGNQWGKGKLQMKHCQRHNGPRLWSLKLEFNSAAKMDTNSIKSKV